MNWNQYVGERFRRDDGKVFNVQSYEPADHSFCLNEIDSPQNRVRVPAVTLTEGFSMVMDFDPPKMLKTIKSFKDGNALLDLALLHMQLNVSLSEQIKMYRGRGFSHWDIYLSIKAAQLIAKDIPNA